MGAVLTLAPSETVTAEDGDALAKADLTHVWTSRRGKLIGGLAAPAGVLTPEGASLAEAAPAEHVWSSRRGKKKADTKRVKHPTARPKGLRPFHPDTLTNPAAG